MKPETDPTPEETRRAIPIILGTLAHVIATRNSKSIKIESVDQFKSLYDVLCSDSVESTLEAMKTREGCMERMMLLMGLRDAGIEFLLKNFHKLSEPENRRLVWALRWMKTGHMDALSGTMLMFDHPELRTRIENPTPSETKPSEA